MTTQAAVDSRQYIIAYPVLSATDCPADLPWPARVAQIRAGVFLPRDDPDWFGRYSYPPRLMLLTSEAIHIVPHPTSNEGPSEFRVADIAFAESGHFLLKGWLRFAGRGFDCKLPYNTRGLPSVLTFMAGLREMLLDPAPVSQTAGAKFGADPNIKFSNALIGELDPAENASALFFQPPKESGSDHWLIHKRTRLAGDVLALTAGRLLWITDRDGGSQSRFGSIASYAPLRTLRSFWFESNRGKSVLHVCFQTDSGWDIPIQPANLEDAEKFVSLARDHKARDRKSVV